MRHVLVLGGTGTVGRAVLDALADADVAVTFTYHSSITLAHELAGEAARTALAVDLDDLTALRVALRELAEANPPDAVIHCAAVASAAPLADITDEAWTRAQRINCQSALVVCQALAPHWRQAGRGDVVLVGALDRTQSLPLPVAFAATQGMISGLTMGLSKELGAFGVRVNMVALGLLGEGLSREVSPHLYEDYQRFSALQRTGTPAEAARAIVWLALDNEYMNGKVVPVNGGI